MSTIITGAIIENGPSDKAQFCALLALAQFANAHGECFPKVATLTAFARSSERRLRDALDKLEQDGWITRERQRQRNGAWKNYAYRINREKLGLKPLGQPADKTSELPDKTSGDYRTKRPVARPADKTSGPTLKSIYKGNPAGLSKFQLGELRAGRSCLVHGVVFHGIEQPGNETGRSSKRNET